MGGRVAVLALVVTGTVAFIDVDGSGAPEQPVAVAAAVSAHTTDVTNRGATAASRGSERRQLVTVELESGVQEISTTAESVAGVLGELGVVVDSDTVVSHDLADAVEPDMTISARTPETSVDTVTETVEFDSEEIDDPTLAKGKRQVETAGRAGETVTTYMVSTVDGVEVERSVVATREISEERTEVVRVGTMKLPDASAKVLSPGEAKSLAKSMVADRGWDAGQFSCLENLWNRESGWRVTAANPSSGAYGIPQSLPGSKMGTVAGDWRTNAKTQMTWGMNYISGRYGNPCGAWGASQAKGWY